MSRLTIDPTDQVQVTVDYLYKELERRIIASPPGLCPVDLQLSFLRLCHAQTCGKCVPCRIGLGQLAKLLEDVLENRATKYTLELISKTARQIADSADCAIGINAALMVLKGLDTFRADYLSHIEAHRCSAELKQGTPCVQGCPAHVDIPGYVALVGAGRYADAIKLIRKDNPFPTACALICEHPCEARCRRTMLDAPVNIRGMKRKAVDEAPSNTVPSPAKAAPTGKRIAIIGAGPSGLTCAYYLQLMGHQTVVFDEKSKLGGMLRYGIPSYRFPRERLQEDLEAILATGVEVRLNSRIGNAEGEISLAQLRQDFDAIYIAIGAHTDKKLRIEGENAKGVMSAVSMLRAIGDENPPDFKNKTVVVVGGGNVAMDCARSSIRLGAKKVIIAYRRRQDDMTALSEEIEGATAEGVELYTLKSPHHIEVDAEGKAAALWAEPQIIGPIDAWGRARTLRKQAELERIPADIIVVAIGQDIDSDSFAEAGLPIKRGTITALPTGALKNMDGLFAGGDCVSGPVTVIRAIAAGKVAAANIDEYLGFHHEITCDVELPEPGIRDMAPCGRVQIIPTESSVRKQSFSPIECGLSDQEACQEAGRCLRCDKFGLSTLKGGRVAKW